jgi:hypothetical protein
MMVIEILFCRKFDPLSILLTRINNFVIQDHRRLNLGEGQRKDRDKQIGLETRDLYGRCPPAVAAFPGVDPLLLAAGYLVIALVTVPTSAQ